MKYPLWLNVCSSITLAFITVGVIGMFFDMRLALLAAVGFGGVTVFGHMAEKYRSRHDPD